MIFRFNCRSPEPAQDMVRLLKRLAQFLTLPLSEVSRHGPFVTLRIEGANVEQRAKVSEFLKKSGSTPLLIKPLLGERRNCYAQG